MAQAFPVSVVVSAQDNATAVIKRVASGIGSAMGRIKNSIRGAIGGIGKSLLTGIGQGIGQGITTAISSAISGSLAAAKEWAQEFIEVGDELATFSAKTGLAVESIQAWRYAAEQADVPTATFNSGIQAFSKSLGLARAGTGKLVSGLKKTSPELLKQLKAAESTEAAFALYVSAMESIQDPAKRAELASFAFAGAGNEMALMAATGSKRLAELRQDKIADGVLSAEQAEQAGKLDEQMNRLNSKWSTFKLRVGNAIATALGPLLTRLGDWYTANKDIINQKVDAAVKLIGDAIARIDWQAVAAGIKSTFDDIKSFVGAIATGIEKVGGLQNALLLLGGALVLGPLTKLLATLTGIGAARIAATGAGAAAAGAAAAGAGAAGAGAAGAAGAGAGVASGVRAVLGRALPIAALAAVVWGMATESSDELKQERADQIQRRAFQGEQDMTALNATPSLPAPSVSSRLVAPQLGSTTMDLINRITPPQVVTIQVESAPGTEAKVVTPPKAGNVKVGTRKVGNPR